MLGGVDLHGKHARWWQKVYAAGIRKLEIVYRPGKENRHADALSRQPHQTATEDDAEVEPTVAAISSEEGEEKTITSLLQLSPPISVGVPKDFGAEQQKDSQIAEIIQYLQNQVLPESNDKSHLIVSQAHMTLDGGVLYLVDGKENKRAIVPQHLCKSILEQAHGGRMAGHFAVKRLYGAISKSWWWKGMYTDVKSHCSSCPQCAIVAGSGRESHLFNQYQCRSHFKLLELT